MVRSTVIFIFFTLLLSQFNLAEAIPTKSAEVTNSKAGAPVNSKSLSLNEQGVAAVKSKKFKEAEDLFQAALSADSKNLTAVFNLASMYINNKKQADAIKLLTAYTKQAPNDAGLYARLGDAHFTLKNVPEAIGFYEKTLNLESDYPGIPKKLGTLYTLTNKFNKAEEQFLKAVEQDPKNGELLATLSSLFLGNGKTQEAISTAKRALQVAPTKEIYVTLGSAYELNKDYKNSVIAYQRAIDLGDSSPELKGRLETLKKMGST